LTRAQAFQPFKARDLVTDGDKSADGLEFRVQKDLVSRSSEDAPVVDRDEVKSDRDGDDFGMFTLAAEALFDAGVTSSLLCVWLVISATCQVSIAMDHLALERGSQRNLDQKRRI
jgi:hypothetical protein